jgi:hypothetical protein
MMEVERLLNLLIKHFLNNMENSMNSFNSLIIKKMKLNRIRKIMYFIGKNKIIIIKILIIINKMLNRNKINNNNKNNKNMN